MRKSTFSLLAVAPTLMFYLAMVSCSGERQANLERAVETGESAEEAGEHAMSEGGAEHSVSEGGGEHSEGGEEGEHGSEGEGEESGEHIGSGETWDAIRNGVRLVLSYDPAANAFVGYTENTAPIRLCGVRVEVHLSTGTELGPTERTDLNPGQTSEVRLPTSGETFNTWTTHPELSPCGN